MGVIRHRREDVLQPPSFDTRNIVDFVDKYRDAHILDSGWREVDPAEWHCDVQKKAALKVLVSLKIPPSLQS